jgi:metal-dependent HD superfamily phosphatase/phosphodiesterase
MTDIATQPAMARLPLAVAADAPAFSVPARHNPRLLALAERLNADEELRQLWRCANVNAADRLGLGDCGEVHVRIVANGALKLLRLLREGGAVPGVVAQHRLTPDDAEVAVVLAAALHDLGLAVAASGDAAGLTLAALKGRELLAGLYGARERTILLAEALHAIGAQPAGAPCLTLEAGVLRLADALDLSKGRVRLSADAERGLLGTAPVEEVTITRAKQPPVRVIIHLRQPEGVEAVETLLLHRLRGSGLHPWVELAARLDSPGEGRLLPLRAWDESPAEPA